MTGGEPLLQQDRPAWEHLLRSLYEQGCRIHVETNGTLAPSPATRTFVETFVVSPKLGNAGAHRGHQNPDLHEDWKGVAESGHAHLKIVCETSDDVARAVLLAESRGIPLSQLWVMPLGATIADLGARWPAIATAAARLRINATHRLHILARGEDRGH